MQEVAYLNVRLDKRRKELFYKLCEEEEIDASQAIRELIDEVIARGYINKERKERIQKLAQGGLA